MKRRLLLLHPALFALFPVIQLGAENAGKVEASDLALGAALTIAATVTEAFRPTAQP